MLPESHSRPWAGDRDRFALHGHKNVYTSLATVWNFCNEFVVFQI